MAVPNKFSLLFSGTAAIGVYVWSSIVSVADNSVRRSPDGCCPTSPADLWSNGVHSSTSTRHSCVWSGMRRDRPRLHVWLQSRQRSYNSSFWTVNWRHRRTFTVLKLQDKNDNVLSFCGKSVGKNWFIWTVYMSVCVRRMFSTVTPQHRLLWWVEYEFITLKQKQFVIGQVKG